MSGLIVPGTIRPVHADPNAPQIGPLHLQREDAQRLRPQQRTFDQEPSTTPVVTVAPEPPPPQPISGYDRALRNTGLVFLGGAGVIALSSLPFFADSGSTSSSSSDGQDIGTVLVVFAAAAGITGFVLLAASTSGSSSSGTTSNVRTGSRIPRVQLVPMASTSTVGLALTGSL